MNKKGVIRRKKGRRKRGRRIQKEVRKRWSRE